MTTNVFLRAAFPVAAGPLRRLLVTSCRPAGILAAVFLLLGLGRAPLPAQQPPADARPNVFLDCEDDLCDPDYFRTEIPWVNWVRQRQDADVHLIVTSEETGGGGRVYRIDLVGTADAGYEDQLVHTAQSTDTDRETLDGIAHTIGIGLLRFASESGFGQLVEFVEKGGRRRIPRSASSPGRRWTIPGTSGSSASAALRASPARRPGASGA